MPEGLLIDIPAAAPAAKITTAAAGFNWKGAPRPTYAHDEVRRRAVLRILPDVMAWLRDRDSGNIRWTKEQTMRDLLESIDSDGYSFAKRLDRFYGWCPDAELVEILEGYFPQVAVEQCIREWIEQNGIQPKLTVGTMLKLTLEWQARHVHRNGPYPANDVGEIVDVGHHNPGKYTIHIASRGDVKEGQGCHGSLVAWEDAETLEVLGTATHQPATT